MRGSKEGVCPGAICCLCFDVVTAHHPTGASARPVGVVDAGSGDSNLTPIRPYLVHIVWTAGRFDTSCPACLPRWHVATNVPVGSVPRNGVRHRRQFPWCLCVRCCRDKVYFGATAVVSTQPCVINGVVRGYLENNSHASGQLTCCGVPPRVP